MSGVIAFDYLVDASGRNGIMALCYLRNRKFHRVFQNVAPWGYWEGAVCSEPGYREGCIAVGSIPDGWLWSIPLGDGRTSIGAVLHKTAFRRNRVSSREEIYPEEITSSPLLTKVCAPATLVSEVMLETDYSYAAETFRGSGFFLSRRATGRPISASWCLSQRSTTRGAVRRCLLSRRRGLSHYEFAGLGLPSFDHVEGLGALDVAVDGLYVTVQPRLGLLTSRPGSAGRRPRRAVS